MNIFDKLGLENKPPIVATPNLKFKLKAPQELVSATQIKKTDSRAKNANNPLLANIESISKRFSMVTKAVAPPSVAEEPDLVKPIKKTKTNTKTKPTTNIGAKLLMKEGDEVAPDAMAEAVKEIERMDAKPDAKSDAKPDANPEPVKNPVM